MEDSSFATTTTEPQNTATLSRKAQKGSDMGSSTAGQEPLAVVTLARRQERRSGSRRTKKSNAGKKKVPPTKEDASSNTDGEGDEKAEVENKIMALQKIVPGGESLGVDKLFEETAGYILELQCQVKALKFLASFVEGSDKENRKFGG